MLVDSSFSQQRKCWFNGVLHHGEIVLHFHPLGQNEPIEPPAHKPRAILDWAGILFVLCRNMAMKDFFATSAGINRELFVEAYGDIAKISQIMIAPLGLGFRRTL